MKAFASIGTYVGLLPLLLPLAISLAACEDGHPRGSITKSGDDNGGGCVPIIVDGKVWTHKIGEAGLIHPGRHKIECGGWIEFDIPQRFLNDENANSVRNLINRVIHGNESIDHEKLKSVRAKFAGLLAQAVIFLVQHFATTAPSGDYYDEMENIADDRFANLPTQ